MNAKTDNLSLGRGTVSSFIDLDADQRAKLKLAAERAAEARRLQEERNDIIIELREEGLTTTLIADELNISPQRVSTILRSHLKAVAAGADEK